MKLKYFLDLEDKFLNLRFRPATFEELKRHGENIKRKEKNKTRIQKLKKLNDII